MERARKGLQGYSNVLRLRLKKTQARPDRSKTKHETQQHRKKLLPLSFSFPAHPHIAYFSYFFPLPPLLFGAFPLSLLSPVASPRVVNFAKNIFSNNPNKQMAACKKYKSRPPQKSREKISRTHQETCVCVLKSGCVSVCARISIGYRKKYIINVNKLSDYFVGAAMFFPISFFSPDCWVWVARWLYICLIRILGSITGRSFNSLLIAADPICVFNAIDSICP